MKASSIIFFKWKESVPSLWRPASSALSSSLDSTYSLKLKPLQPHATGIARTEKRHMLWNRSHEKQLWVSHTAKPMCVLGVKIKCVICISVLLLNTRHEVFPVVLKEGLAVADRSENGLDPQRRCAECVWNPSKASLMWNLAGPLAKPDSQAVVSLINQTQLALSIPVFLYRSLSNSTALKMMSVFVCMNVCAS